MSDSPLDVLPLEVLDLIAGESEHAYHALIHAYPRFARSITAGKRVDFAISFGHDCTVKLISPAFWYPRYNVMMWTRNGLTHRLDGPAFIASDCSKYFRDNMPYRAVGPTCVSPDTILYENERGPHREHGPALVQYGADETIKYYLNGVLHRDDGPAIISLTASIWMRNNAKYRACYPARLVCRYLSGFVQVMFEYSKGSHPNGLRSNACNGDIAFFAGREYCKITNKGVFCTENERV